MNFRRRKCANTAIIERPVMRFSGLILFIRVDASRSSAEEVLYFLLARAISLTLSRLILVCAEMCTHVLEGNDRRASLHSAFDWTFAALSALMNIHHLRILLCATVVRASNTVHVVLQAHRQVCELDVFEICEGIATHWAEMHMSIVCGLHDLRAAVPAQQVCAVDLHRLTWKRIADWTREVVLGMLDLIVWRRRD